MQQPSTHPDDLDGDDRQRARGFEAGEPVREFYNCFSLEEAKASLFDSTYAKVRLVYLSDDKNGDVSVPVVITKAEARFTPYAVQIGASPAGCHEDPDWYFEGWVPKSGYDAFENVTRVRILMFSEGEIFLWQVVPDNPTDGPIETI